MNWKPWLYGLISGTISAVAGAVLLVIVVPEKFSFADLSTLLRVVFAFGLVGAANYLKQSPLPPKQ